MAGKAGLLRAKRSSIAAMPFPSPGGSRRSETAGAPGRAASRTPFCRKPDAGDRPHEDGIDIGRQHVATLMERPSIEALAAPKERRYIGARIAKDPR
ncbi:hypothetical protein [Methylobacterium sp. NEAU K]|uniref:hypothetical protein n=1 Tax=Methylobacterium sp. NEAU K TaxID=3064946 RepID=UPI0027370CE0|nr:hypothetical protein [Methylobacterium sp. NEAU K]MDP4002106.1 hypothetical protein [Methylobacterium sp. NEAU K]